MDDMSAESQKHDQNKKHTTGFHQGKTTHENTTTTPPSWRYPYREWCDSCDPCTKPSESGEAPDAEAPDAFAPDFKASPRRTFRRMDISLSSLMAGVRTLKNWGLNQGKSSKLSGKKHQK